MGTATLTNGRMTFVNQNSPSTNFDYSTRGALRSLSGATCYTYLYFSRPFPLGATITSATLRVFTTGTSQSGTKTINAKRVLERSTYSRMNWNNRNVDIYPGSNAVESKTGTLVNGTEWEIDVTTQMQAVSDGDDWFGWQISSNFNPVVWIYGPDYSSTWVRPVLEVTWSDRPDKPQTLSPAGGRAITGEKPILRCDYVDVSGSTKIAGMQVQFSTTDSFTSPYFDSGDVAVSTPQLSLSATAFPALTEGQEVFWRCRVKDAAGLWSWWSDSESFKRVSQGTLIIENPAVAPNDFVSEATPPILWSFSGATQVSYQMWVDQEGVTLNSKQKRMKQWTSGKITSTDNSITLPKGVITTNNAGYRLVVYVWDGVARESIPGDPAYVRVERFFDYRLDNTIDGVTSLTATPQDPRPKTVLTWARATAPDSFSVVRNGEIIAAGLTPEDVQYSANMFPDSSFEGWVDGAWGTGGGAVVTRDTTWKQFGTYSIKVTPTEGGPTYSSAYPWGPVGGTMDRVGLEPGRTYTLSGYVRLAAPQTSPLSSLARSLVLSVQGGADEGTIPQVSTAQAPNTAGVHRVWQTFRVPEDATNVYLRLYNGSTHDEDAVWWDGLLLEEGSVLNDYYSTQIYRWIDHRPPPKTSLSYQVRAVVNGKTSETNPTVKTKVRSSGIWLCGDGKIADVMIVGRDQPSMTLGETSEIHEVIGSTEVVLVSQSQRGYEGSISGRLVSSVDDRNYSAQTWRNGMLKFKENPTQQLWLTVGDMTIPVLVRNINVSPRMSPELSFDVSFDYYEIASRNEYS